MPATFGGQLTIILGIILSLLALARMAWVFFHTLLLHVEWLEQLWLIHSRQIGGDVPEWLIKKHMKLNGNDKLSTHEKDRLYGPNRPPSDPKRKSARAMGLVPEESKGDD